MELYDRLKGAFFGAIIGDIYGAPYEFLEKDDLEENFPEYKSGEFSKGGPFCLPKGYYTDDTSMGLCLANSLIHKEGKFVPHDVMYAYVSWYKDGYMSSKGYCFDIGDGTSKVLNQYIKTREFDKSDNKQGNGALMRIFAIIVGYFKTQNLYYIANCDCELTHNNTVAKQTNSIFLSYLEMIYHDDDDITISKSKIKLLLDGQFRENYIPNPSGYCEDSMYIAVDSFLKTNNYLDCIIKAVSYAHDTDTNACIAGTIAGFAYGYSSIPKHLLDFKDFEKISEIFEKLYLLNERTELYCNS